MQVLAALLLWFALLAVVICLPAILLVWAWGLVMVPLFHLPAITFLQAWAILFIVGLFKTNVTVKKDK